MKLKFLIILSLFTFNSISYSQVFSDYGFKTGLALAYQSEKGHHEIGYFPTENRLGFTVGIFGEFFKYKYISAIAEANFVQKGANNQSINPVINNYSTLNVLSVPLFGRLTFDYGFVSAYISGGPRADIVISKDEGIIKEQYADINPVNVGITLSAGAEIPLSQKTALLFEAGYSPDITTYQNTNFSRTDVGIIRNISFEFRTGLKFNH